MNIAILFSGGLDSTYLVYKNLKEGNTVYPYYVNITNNGDRPDMEFRTTKKLYQVFKDEFPGLIYPPKEIGSFEIGVENPWRIIQPQIWIFFLSMLQYSKNIDEFQIGYIKNDDALDYLKDIKKLHNSFKGFPAFENKFIPLKFPLLKYDKYELMKLLPEKYSKLIVSCENAHKIGDEYVSCGTCHNCLIYEIVSKNDSSIDRNLFPLIYNHKEDKSYILNDKVYIESVLGGDSKYKLPERY